MILLICSGGYIVQCDTLFRFSANIMCSTVQCTVHYNVQYVAGVQYSAQCTAIVLVITILLLVVVEVVVVIVIVVMLVK